MTAKLIMVISTFEKKKDAQHVADLALNARFAACVQIGQKIESRYWWNNELTISQEYPVYFKTEETHYTQLEALIQTHHPYETPEIIAISITKVSASYASWCLSELENAL